MLENGTTMLTHGIIWQMVAARLEDLAGQWLDPGGEILTTDCSRLHTAPGTSFGAGSGGIGRNGLGLHGTVGVVSLARPRRSWSWSWCW